MRDEKRYCMINLQNIINDTKEINEEEFSGWTNFKSGQTTPKFSCFTFNRQSSHSFNFIFLSIQIESLRFPKHFNVKKLEILELKIANFLTVLKKKLPTRLTVHKGAQFLSYSYDIHPSPAFKLNKVRKRKAPCSLWSTAETSII